MTYINNQERDAELFRTLESNYDLTDPLWINVVQRFKLERFMNIPDHKHQFITIALPTENYALDQLKSVIDNLEYSYLENAYLIVENFSGITKKENLHVHILKQGIYSKTKLIRDMSRKFKVLPNFINVKKGTKEKDYLNRLQYINGEKQSELKKENHELDRKWREENGFQQIYSL